MEPIASPLEFLKQQKRAVLRHRMNLPGWRTERKLVILESDDWGSIRMPSREVYRQLLQAGDRADGDPFTRYDSLASEEDLARLFEVLTTYRDWRGNHPVLTANCAMANPDFERIEASGFEEFYAEPFPVTLAGYPEHRGALALWRQGIRKKIFFPQLHCREHLNVRRWLKDLRRGKPELCAAFALRMISGGNSFAPDNQFAYMDALNFDERAELAGLKDSILEGSRMFAEIFGYSSRSWIAPCYIWSPELEGELDGMGIEYIQGSDVQLLPENSIGTSSLGKKRHYLGQRNRRGQVYLLRNCEFEPSWNLQRDWVNQCLGDIELAFKWRKPATISTHRLNYIGYIDKANGERNLVQLSRLLEGILKRWPEVEFITSVELGDLIKYGEFH